MGGEKFIVRTYRYRLSPDDRQSQAMAQFAGAIRFVYNLALEQRRDWWRQFKATTGKHISFYSQSRELKELRAATDWIGAVPYCSLEQALSDLDDAYDRFYRGKGGYPSPRRKGENDSFRIPGKEFHSPIRQVSERLGEIRLTKIGWCRFRLSRPLPAIYKLLSATVTLDPVGWHLCLCVRLPQPTGSPLPGSIGIDRGIANTIALSDGYLASQPVAHLRAIQRRARGHQRRLSRQKKGSKRRETTRRLLAKAKAKIARIRLHWNHEQTTRIVANYGTVAIESLKTSVMTRSARGSIEEPGVNVRAKSGLNRSILENGWHQFERLLAYKIEAAGGRLIKVDPAYTSQTCSACGSVSKTHRKSQAVFKCSDCGHSAHADSNAALNILRAGEQPASRGAARPPVKREPSVEIT